MKKQLCHRIYARPLRRHTTIIESAGDACALRRSGKNDINDITLVLSVISLISFFPLNMIYINGQSPVYDIRIYYLAPEGVARYCFHPVCLCVCVCVCVSVCVCICVSGQYFGILLLGYQKRYRSEICTGYLQGCIQCTKINLPSQVKGQGHRDGILLFEGTVISQKLSDRICFSQTPLWILYSMKQ